MDTEAADQSSSDLEAEDSELDLDEDQLEEDTAGLGTEGPVATGQLQQATIDGVSQQEEDALLNKIQSSSKKQQR